jgi:hypothetical protein
MGGINGGYGGKSGLISKAWTVEKIAVSNQQSAFSHSTYLHAQKDVIAGRKGRGLNAEC